MNIASRGMAAVALLSLFTVPFASARAHGIAGNRVFPATLATDDPAAASEISLPTVSWMHQPRGDDGSIPTETDAGGELDLLLAPHFAVGIASSWSAVTSKGNPGAYGFQNVEVSGKYQFYTDDAREIIFSAGLVAEVGGTGAARIGSDDTSTFTPTFYFGKGFGDLPDSMALLRPFAITGTLGFAIPQSHANSDFFQPGIAIEYSMPYLKSAVKDYGLPEFVNHLVPVVEMPLSYGLDRGNHEVSGSINPGLIYQGDQWQFGIEAMIPVSAGQSHNVGVIGQFHVYLDDFMPALFAQPAFGGNEQ